MKKNPTQVRGRLSSSPFVQRMLPQLFSLLLLLLASMTGSAQEKVITGRVADSLGVGVPDVTVTVKGTNKSTRTNAQGVFSITAANDAVLRLSHVAYVAKEVRADQAVSVVMQSSATSFDDVVVVGYGTMKKKDLTGAIAQIKPDKIANENPKTVQDILRGTPGVRIGFDPSAKGGGGIEIRGRRSVYNDGGHNNPLIVLDGMLFYGELSEINPDDIEQIDVLKDASATAVYGSKAASGVLLIQTKKGKSGKPVITATMNLGATQKSIIRERFNTTDYLQHRQDWLINTSYDVNPQTGVYEAYQKGEFVTKPAYFTKPEQLPSNISLDTWRGYTSNTANESDLSIWARRLGFTGNALQNLLDGKVTNWNDKTFRTGINYDLNASVSGGGDRVNYYLSMGYLKNEGAVVSDNYRAIRSNFKIDAKVTKWFEVGANINFQDRSDGNVDIDMDQTMRNSPYADYYDANGLPIQFPLSEAYSQRGYNYDFQKQYLELQKGYTVLNTIVNAKIKLPFNITYSFNASPRMQFFYDRYFMSAALPGSNPTTRGANREQSKSFNYSLNNTINWDQYFGDHHVMVTLVQEAEDMRSWTDRIEARAILPSDALGFHNTKNGSKEYSSYSSNDSRQTADGLLARAFYAYDNRYMITASIRRDGYSAFGQSNPYATFPSAAVAWTFTNEKFWKWNNILSTGKLRFSYGENGNRSLANPYVALSNLYEGAGRMQGYLNSAGQQQLYRYLMAERMANPNLKWETTTSYNLGLDFGFLKDRITGSLEYYNMTTNDMIMLQRINSFTGFLNITTNLGQVDNSGVELTLNTVNIRKRNFEWNTTIGVSYNKNQITHLYYDQEDIKDANGNVIGSKERDDISNGWFIGKPIGAIWDYRVTGIWQTNEVEEAKKFGQQPGDPKVANNYTADDVKNANGTVTPVYNDKDKEFLGQSIAPWQWSMRNEFIFFNNLSVSFNMYSYMGHKSTNGEYLNNDDDGGRMAYAMANLPAKQYWTPEHPTNDYGRIQARGPVGASGVGKLYDRSFIRLDNIAVGYTLPADWTKRITVNKVKVFGTVRNAAVWSNNWKLGDPETGGWAARVYNLGVNLIF
ncbi:SusC/RagA family TonB-linked outer membrane protein [Paraflavitalea pollutisoli]|uniref:SusC/RagA family TonB-linked outer membrane protein n=1 Tax=Paraflavitalea pollutisoli TaxID=3034143 RepID=UPI0023EC5F37|nr:SusC/RagA family TonB-linked outer membrane protein [Paraflavitalea sp. H1-2-19X]